MSTRIGVKMNIGDDFSIRSGIQELEEFLKDRETKFAENLHRHMELMDEFASDIIIVCRDVILPGHKYILSSRCEVLSEILSSGVDQLGKRFPYKTIFVCWHLHSFVYR